MLETPIKSTCKDCGYVDPVSHIGLFLSETLDVLLTAKRPPRESPKVERRAILDTIFNLFIFTIPLFLGFMQGEKNPARFVTERSEVVWKEAKRRGIPIEQIQLFGKATEWYRAQPLGQKWEYFLSLPIPDPLLAKDFSWMDDKTLFKQELAKEAIPVPISHSVTTLAEAEKVFGGMQKPVIIKPRRGSRARHTTTYISTQKELQRAFRSAQQLCYFVVVEQHLFGSVCRATAVNGTVVGFFQMDPPRITGDGIHTIKELIALKNKNKNAGVEDITWTEEIEQFVENLGYTKESVLETKKTIDLLKQTGRFVGGYTKEILEEVHPKLLVYIEHATKVLDIPVVGFDLIIADPTSDPDTQTWGFIEANSLPYIDRHHNAREGKKVNVAGYVWDLWKKK